MIDNLYDGRARQLANERMESDSMINNNAEVFHDSICQTSSVIPVVFGELVKLSALSTVGYQSDLYHDAMTLAEHFTDSNLRLNWMAEMEISFEWMARDMGSELGVTKFGKEAIQYHVTERKKWCDLRYKLYRVTLTPQVSDYDRTRVLDNGGWLLNTPRQICCNSHWSISIVDIT